jgi:hypothetical protein
MDETTTVPGGRAGWGTAPGAEHLRGAGTRPAGAAPRGAAARARRRAPRRARVVRWSGAAGEEKRRVPGGEARPAPLRYAPLSCPERVICNSLRLPHFRKRMGYARSRPPRSCRGTRGTPAPRHVAESPLQRRKVDGRSSPRRIPSRIADGAISAAAPLRRNSVRKCICEGLKGIVDGCHLGHVSPPSQEPSAARQARVRATSTTAALAPAERGTAAVAGAMPWARTSSVRAPASTALRT